ncbi:hypothetical protein [Nocardioides endophyticus]|uniref:hypothetical protein n=1 Tax=Nocardioides endophyticus TaxID=1353775 RepID=UPI003CD05D65
MLPTCRRTSSVARAILDGGLRVIEVTVRTPAALEAISLITAEVPEIRLGVGSVRHPRDVEARSGRGCAVPGAGDEHLDSTGLPCAPQRPVGQSDLAHAPRRHGHSRLGADHDAGRQCE